MISGDGDLGCGGGCCAGIQTATPVASYNRPGLPALTYRMGTHGRFLHSMLARLSSSAHPQLQRLTTREPDDASVAMLDCWAMIGDVLTFYQERIANEGYLRTATEPESLNQIGRLVGYRPRPPMGSSGFLAYTLDPDASTVIPASSQVKSVPDPGQLPQTFETVADLTAREKWNVLAVRRERPQKVDPQTAQNLGRVELLGTTAILTQGDRVLFNFGRSNPVVRFVLQSAADFQRNRTVVTFGPAVADFTNAVAALQAAIKVAQGSRPASPWTLETGSTLDFAASEFSQDPPGADELAELNRRLTEQRAVARAHAPAGVLAWYDADVAAVNARSEAALPLAAAAFSSGPPEIEALQGQARALLCQPNDEDRRGGTDLRCRAADALVALAPLLHALRKPPSTPPASPRELDSQVADLFAPGSDIPLQLLVAADPRLSGNLYRAMTDEQVAPPSRLSGLQVMRIKAKPFIRLADDADAHPGPAVEAATTAVTIRLDARYDGIVPGSQVIGEADDQQVIRQVVGVRDVVVDAGKGVHVTITELTLDGEWLDDVSDNDTTIWAQGEALTVAPEQVSDDVGGDRIELAELYDGLRPGRWLIVSGERTDVPYTSGVSGTELVMLAGVHQAPEPGRTGDRTHSTLLLGNALAYTYRRDTVTIYGNVVAADQGETRSDVLGSGDATRPGQSFALHQVSGRTPLTWLPADNPLGAEDTLTVRVDGVRWHETDLLLGLGPPDHGYALTVAPDASAAVQFGDGKNGARVPTGVENVTATYRIGGGASGNIGAGKISQLASRPLGVNAVINPLAATGGTDGDWPDDARDVIPLRMLALDRLVSVPDYAAFTRARAGIGKAVAHKLFDGEREVVHVTIAALGDAPVGPASKLFTKLQAALADFGDPHLPIRVATRDLVLIVLNAGVKVLPDYSWDIVEPQVRQAVLAVLGFDRRELAEPAFLSDVIAAVQTVPGVDYVDVDVFDGICGDISPLELVTIVDRLVTARSCVPAARASYEEIVHTVETDPNTGNAEALTSIATRYGVTVDDLVRLNAGLRQAQLSEGDQIVVRRGIRPAQLALLSPDVKETLNLRRIR